MKNTPPGWTIGISTAVEIQARQMASIIRFRDPSSPEYTSTMQHICRMLAAEQQKVTCQQTQRSPEDANRSTGAASGAASEVTSSSSTRNSALAAPIAGSASARTTTTASEADATSEKSAITAAKSSASHEVDHVRTAQSEHVSSRGFELLDLDGSIVCGFCGYLLHNVDHDTSYLECTYECCVWFKVRLTFTLQVTPEKD